MVWTAMKINKWPMHIYWIINWLPLWWNIGGKLGENIWRSYRHHTYWICVVTTQPIWEGWWGCPYACLRIWKGLRVLCLHMNLGPMHVIVPKNLIKGFRVILACRLLLLCASYQNLRKLGMYWVNIILVNNDVSKKWLRFQPQWFAMLASDVHRDHTWTVEISSLSFTLKRTLNSLIL